MVAVGVDGCRAGWFAVRLADTGPPDFDVFGAVQSLWRRWSDEADLSLIDIPIGLGESTSARACDREARRLLGAQRASSVFNPPVRAALSARSWSEAADRNHEACGLRLSLQTWGIVPKIREVDAFLRGDPTRQTKLRETHPEVLFRFLNGGRATRHRKSSSAGIQERIALLERVLPDALEVAEAALANFARKDVARDDVLDAMVAAVTAYRFGHRLETLPPEPDRDAMGLAMEIVVPPAGGSSEAVWRMPTGEARTGPREGTSTKG